MERSESKRESDKKYKERTKGTYSTFTVNMKADEMERFLRICKEQGVTPHSVFLCAARKFMETYDGPQPEVGKPGPKPMEYDKELFATLYRRTKAGEMKATEAAAALKVSLQKWYRLARAETARLAKTEQ